MTIFNSKLRYELRYELRYDQLKTYKTVYENQEFKFKISLYAGVTQWLECLPSKYFEANQGYSLLFNINQHLVQR